MTFFSKIMICVFGNYFQRSYTFKVEAGKHMQVFKMLIRWKNGFILLFLIFLKEFYLSCVAGNTAIRCHNIAHKSIHHLLRNNPHFELVFPIGCFWINNRFLEKKIINFPENFVLFMFRFLDLVQRPDSLDLSDLIVHSYLSCD